MFVETKEAENEKKMFSLWGQQITLLKSQNDLITQLLEQVKSQNESVNKVMSKIQEPLDHYKLAYENSQRENKLLQRQLELQQELEKVRAENYNLRTSIVGNISSNEERKTSSTQKFFNT